MHIAGAFEDHSNLRGATRLVIGCFQDLRGAKWLVIARLAGDGMVTADPPG
jgi:hypothetical protein